MQDVASIVVRLVRDRYTTPEFLVQILAGENQPVRRRVLFEGQGCYAEAWDLLFDEVLKYQRRGYDVRIFADMEGESEAAQGAVAAIVSVVAHELDATWVREHSSDDAFMEQLDLWGLGLLA